MPRRRYRPLTLQPLESRIQPAALQPLRVALISDAVAQAAEMQAAASNGVNAVVFDSDSGTLNGLIATLQAISDANGGAPIGHLGLVAHGNSGAVEIGLLDTLESADLANPQVNWSNLRALLTPNARIDLYACNVAAGPLGESFVRALASSTGADVYASTDPVGNARGADWTWEFNTGVRPRTPLFSHAALKSISGLVLEDLFEENDSIAVTSSQPAGGTNSPNFGLLTAGKTIKGSLEDDADYYRFSTAGPSTHEHFVSIEQTAATANADMALFDSSGTAIQYSQSGGTTDSISLQGLPTGTYFVLVYPRNAEEYGTAYDLRVEVPADSADDAFENNNSIAQVDAEPEGAANSPNLGAITGSRTIAALVQDDALGYDWFKFRTLGPGTDDHFVSIAFNGPDGNLDLGLFDAGGNAIQYSQSGGDTDSISLYGLPSGTYYALAYSRTAVRPALASYDLQIVAPQDTSDDPYENNDSISAVDSQPVGEPNSPNLGVVAGSRSFLGLVQNDSVGYDWFRFTTTAVGTTQHFVSIAFDAANGNLDLGLYDSVGEALTFSQSGDDTDSISLNGRPAGTYYVLAYRRTIQRSAMASYDLQIKAPGTGLGIVGATTVTEGDGGLTNAVFTVTRSDSAGSASVDYQTDDGSATVAELDYQSTSGTLSFAAGETTKTIAVPVKGDLNQEDDETFFLNLFNATDVFLNTTQSVGTIVNDDTAGTIQFSAPTYSVSESAGVANIKVTRTGGADGQVTVHYASSDGSASSPGDYGVTAGTLTFNQGEVSKTIAVPIVNDGDSESDETINLILTDATGGAGLGDPIAAELTILANDVKPGKFQFSVAEYTVTENGGTATIEVQRVEGDDGVVSVKYSTANKTALADSDYTADSGTLTFEDGETSQTFEIEILNDTVYEPTEYLNLKLSGPTGGATFGAPRTARLNILNDDGLMSPGTVVAGDGKTGVIKVVDGKTGVVKSTIQAFPVGFKSGVRVATGDVNGDGTDDIIAAAGPNGSTTVRVFDGQTGQKMTGILGEFAHGLAMANGVHVAAGDINADTRDDIVVVGAGPGGGPHVKVFDGQTRQVIDEFDVFVGSAQPVSLAVGDVVGDGSPEIVVAVGGAGGTGGEVKVLSFAGVELRSTDLPTMTTAEVSVALGDLNGDGKQELIVGAGPGAGPHVKVFDGATGSESQTLSPYSKSFKGGVRVAVGDVTGDGVLDLVTAASAPGQKMKVFDFATGLPVLSFAPLGAGRSGIFVGVAE